MFLALVVLSAGGLGISLLSGIVSADLGGVSVLGLIMVWAFSWFELVSRIAVAEFQPLEYLKMNLGRSFLILVGMAAAAWLTKSSLWTAVATAAGMVMGAFLGDVSIPRPSWRRFDRDLARDVLVSGIPLAASLALYSLIDGGTRLLLAQLDSVRAFGIYTAASLLVLDALGVIGTAISSAGYSLVVREGSPRPVRGKFRDAVLAAQAVQYDADLLLVARRMSFTIRSEDDLGVTDFWLIFAPRWLR